MRKLLAAAFLSALLLPGALVGCGGNDGSPTPSTRPPQSTGPQSADQGQRPGAPDDVIENRPGGPGDPGHSRQTGAAGDEGPEPADAFPPQRSEPGTRPAPAGDEQGIKAAVHTYINALDAHDGKIVCRVFAPGALSKVELPVHKGSCPASVTASIGFAEPGGQPEWRNTHLVDSDSVVLVKGGDGRLTGTVVHQFAGSREPSIEDDVIYLRKSGGHWLIVQPSTTFYRAIGVGDVPLSALAPPKG